MAKTEKRNKLSANSSQFDFNASKDKTNTWQVISEYLLCILGGVIYAAAVNLFVFPAGIYIGNMTGIAQIIQDLVKLAFPQVGDLMGYLVIALNLPLLIISFSSINRRFFLKTLMTVIALSATMQFVPVRFLIPDITDPLTQVIIGGVLSGFGAGLCLHSGGSGGGVDILGVYMTMKRKGFSVGKVTILIALIVYAYAFFKFPPSIVVYSILFILLFGFVVDRVHFQNIKIHVLIRTNDKKVLELIKGKLHRGATYWNAFGAYADAPTYFVSTVISKYELETLRRGIMGIDPFAFIIESNNVDVTGNFVAHLF
ncbi:MAG: YitT family protein [Anaerolineaceae bacterium]|nr:YitT family protein [Anaerolineaceae bacterium]